MKIYNLRRGNSKTVRLLYISEYTGAPILCVDQQHKKMLQDQARGLNAKIPEPITITELNRVRGTETSNEYIVDEALSYLSAIISNLTGGKLNNPLAVSFSE